MITSEKLAVSRRTFVPDLIISSAAAANAGLSMLEGDLKSTLVFAAVALATPVTLSFLDRLASDGSNLPDASTFNEIDMRLPQWLLTISSIAGLGGVAVLRLLVKFL